MTIDFHDWTIMGALRWILSAIILGIIAYVFWVFVEANVRNWVEEKHWDKFLSRALEKMPDLRPYRRFWFGIGVVFGAALITWLVWAFPAVMVDAAPTTVVAPQSGPVQPQHDVEWKRIRQAANRDISDYLAGPFQVFSRTAYDMVLISSRQSQTVGTQLKKAQGLEELLEVTFNEQGRMLSQYNGIDDVFDMTDWNYLAKKLQPALNEYILTLAQLPPDEPLNQHDGFPAADRFVQAVNGLQNWLNTTEGNLGESRARLEKTVVHQ
jgi:uncharacterized protein YggT (Ycf19 family)